MARGLSSAQIVVFALPEANAIAVANQVYKAVEEMSHGFPEGLKYAIHFDTTRFVREAVSKVYETLFEAGILVLVVIMVFLQSFRALLVPATTVPVTIIGAFAAMIALGFSINLMTLFALVLAIGIVVDDAIVIVENSSYYVEMGLPPKDAAIKAMEELTGPIMGITMALVSVFLPAAFLPGITGQIFRQFALVIAATSVISAINAVTLKPAQCALYLRPRGGKRPNWFYRGFNRAYEAGKASLHAARSPDGGPCGPCVGRLLPHHRGLGLALREPPHRFSADGRPGVRHPSRPPAGRRLPAQERERWPIESTRFSKETPGIASWVTIGGYSILDAANVPTVTTTFVVYKEWSERGAAMTQEKIVSHLNGELSEIQEAMAFVVIPPPIRGLGQTGGFQMMVEDRRGLAWKSSRTPWINSSGKPAPTRTCEG